MQKLQKDREDLHAQSKQESKLMLDRFKEQSDKIKSQDDKQQQLLAQVNKTEIETQKAKADLKRVESQINTLEQ